MTSTSSFVRAQLAAFQFALLKTGLATEDGGLVRFGKAVTALQDMDCRPLDTQAAHKMDNLRMIVMRDGPYAVEARWHGAHMRWELEFKADAQSIDNPTGVYAIVHWAEATLPMHVQRDMDAIADEYARTCPRKVA